MNCISTNHRGGIGNVMFKLAAVVGTALDNNVDYIFSKNFIRPGIDPDYNNYESNILRNFKFQNNLDGNWLIHTEPGFNYTPINYVAGTNLLLDGFFQSERYFINHKQHIIDLFKPTDDHKQQILKTYPDLTKFVSIHVRRGDYLNFPNHYPQQSLEYYQSAAEQIGIDKTYIIFSDDIEGCKSLFDFIPNKFFFNSGADWIDMYVMSMCEHNIICNSTFSWWGAYLNENSNKIVVAPSQWFGSAYDSLDTSDLIPSSWNILDK